jgi:hypothetical protein
MANLKDFSKHICELAYRSVSGIQGGQKIQAMSADQLHDLMTVFGLDKEQRDLYHRLRKRAYEDFNRDMSGYGTAEGRSHTLSHDVFYMTDLKIFHLLNTSTPVKPM